MADLNFEDVRKKFPQYNDLSDEQLAQGLHKKYYADLPFDKFSEKIGYKKAQPDTSAMTVQTGGEGDAFSGVQETVQPSKLSYPEQIKEAGSAALGIAAAGGRGAAKTMLGTPGDIESLLAYKLPEFLGAKKTPEAEQVQVFPRSDTVGKMLESLGAGVTPEKYKGFETAGEVLGGLKGYGGRVSEIAAPVVEKGSEKAKTAYDILKGTEGKTGIESLVSRLKSGEIEKTVVPQRGTTPEDLRIIKNEIAGADADLSGASALEKIKANVNALQAQRQKIAAETYGAARSSMDARTAGGDVFQESEPGKDLIAYFKNKITPVDGQIAVSEAEEREINGIMRDLVGKTERVEPSAILNEAGEPVTAASLKTSYSSPDVLRELLRKLRDRANGSIAEGYGALNQQRAGDFAEKLAQSLGEWDGELAKADKIYKEQSALLHPTRTTRGKAATKREKYDMNEYAVDPKTVAPKFFSSRQGVEQFTDLVGGNVAAVEQEAEKYALSQLKGKSPEAMRSWFNNAQNAGWLNYDTLPKTTAEIAKRIYALEYETVAKPISEVVKNFTSGVIKAEELPSKLKAALSGKDYPTEPVKRLMSEIDATEKALNKTKAARDLVKKLTIGGGLLGAGFEARKILGQ